MKVERLVSLIFILLKKKRVTARYLSDYFGVSLRTVYRDIESLEQAGVPVVSYQGAEGGYELVEGYRIDKPFLSSKEASVIVEVLKGVNRVFEDFELESFFSKMESGPVGISNFAFDMRTWGMNEDFKQKLNELNKAIDSRHIIEFDYANNQGEISRRTAKPYKILLKGSSWYLLAFCILRGENRIFKVSRIQDLSIHKDIFSAEEIDNSYDDFSDIYSWRDSSEKLILKFYPRAFGTVEDFFYMENILRKEKDYWIVETHFPIDGWVQGFILSFGEDVEVIEPASLRKKILEKAEKVRDVYIQKKGFQ